MNAKELKEKLEWYGPKIEVYVENHHNELKRFSIEHQFIMDTDGSQRPIIALKEKGK